jgi:hypothetical protein
MPAMSVAAAGASRGFALVRVDLDLPRLGAWTADLVIASESVLEGKVEIRIGSSLVLAGTVSRGRTYRGLAHARVVAGANGLRSKVTPKHYTTPTLRKVVNDVLADAGEALAPSSDTAVLNTQLFNWTTMRMPAGQAVRCLVERAGDDISWRHLPDGTVWIGRETWPTSPITEFADGEGGSPEADVVDVILVSPEVLPGTTLGGRQIDHVQYVATAAGLRSTLWLVS